MTWTPGDENRFIDAVLALRSRDEARRFLRDLMTKDELNEFSKRFQIAEMLQHKSSHSAIKKAVGTSEAGIERIAKWLKSDLGGYRLVIDRLQRKADKEATWKTRRRD